LLLLIQSNNVRNKNDVSFSFHLKSMIDLSQRIDLSFS
jgi:hypothetical protein